MPIVSVRRGAWRLGGIRQCHNGKDDQRHGYPTRSHIASRIDSRSLNALRLDGDLQCVIDPLDVGSERLVDLIELEVMGDDRVGQQSFPRS